MSYGVKWWKRYRFSSLWNKLRVVYVWHVDAQSAAARGQQQQQPAGQKKKCFPPFLLLGSCLLLLAPLFCLWLLLLLAIIDACMRACVAIRIDKNCQLEEEKNRFIRRQVLLRRWRIRFNIYLKKNERRNLYCYHFNSQQAKEEKIERPWAISLNIYSYIVFQDLLLIISMYLPRLLFNWRNRWRRHSKHTQSKTIEIQSIYYRVPSVPTISSYSTTTTTTTTTTVLLLLLSPWSPIITVTSSILKRMPFTNRPKSPFSSLFISCKPTKATYLLLSWLVGCVF